MIPNIGDEQGRHTESDRLNQGRGHGSQKSIAQ